MKRIYLIVSIVVMVIAACQQTPKTVPVDVKAEEAAINYLFDKFNASRDADTLAAFLTEDALCCGTDPSEFWDKQQMTDGWRQLLSPDFEIHFISERKIKVAADGNSASVVEQYIMPIYTPKIPWRNVYHLVKTNDHWMIDFLSCAFIPKNEDMSKLNQAVE